MRVGAVVVATTVAFYGCGSSSITTTAPSSPKCQVSVTNSPSTASADGSAGTIAIETTRDCTWIAASGASWIAITSTAEGQGAGSVTYRVAPNSDPAPRHSVIGVNDTEVTVAQEPGACHFTVALSDAVVPPNGGSLSVPVTASAPTCAWTAGTSVTWIDGSTAPRTGNGTVTWTVQPNVGEARTGGVTVAGQALTVLQQGAACESTLSPSSASIDFAGGIVAIQVTVPTGCGWTKLVPVDWVTVEAGTTSGPGLAKVTVAANPASTPRQTTLVIANRSFTITQSASTTLPPQQPGPTPAPGPTPTPAPIPCQYSLGLAGRAVAATGGSGLVNISTTVGCLWSASASVPWLSITGATSGTGAGTLNFSVTPNATTAVRTGTLTIAGQTFTVTQAAAECTFSISRDSDSVAAAGGTGSVTITTAAGCAWAASDNAAWLSLTNANGTGSGTVNFTAAANPTTTARIGTITVGGQIFTVTQAAAPCVFSINPASQAVAAAGGAGSVTITTTAGCAWTATVNAGWLSITGASTGAGTGPVTFSVSANATTAARVGTITIGGQTFTVNQAAAACTFSISPASQAVPSGGGNGSVTITTTAGCAWSAIANDPWLSLTSASNGIGAGQVNFKAVANMGPKARAGTLTVAGQNFGVTQAAKGK
jgi:hypothetical protein